MKHLYCTIIIIIALLTPNLLAAQETQQERRSPRMTRGERVQENDSKTPELTISAQKLNERTTQEIGNARWARVIYRELDLMKEKNAPLHYPLRPLNGYQNLFSTLFKLISENKVDAYEYLGDYEEFEEKYKVNFKQMLDRFYIYYEEVKTKTGNTTIIVNDSDIPSADIHKYYIKEMWYFDQNNSVFDVKLLAICPILHSTGDIGEQTYPMFWLPYENIRPYIRNNYIMTSNTNNAKTFTIDDYFRRRMFDGEIIKTENLINLSLAQYCPTPDSLKMEQEKIEKQLIIFRESLYMKSDTTPVRGKRHRKQ
jgi:gliding motility associated protien GldN